MCLVNGQFKNVTDYSSFINKYTTKFKNELAGNNVAGLSIAVVDRDGVIWSEGFGYFNKQEPVAVTANTPFLIGSITKTFTAAAIMQLYENGVIDIDAPLKKYIPEFNLIQVSGNEQNVTVRQLMTHHAGIPDFLTNKHPKKADEHGSHSGICQPRLCHIPAKYSILVFKSRNWFAWNSD